MAFQKYPDNLLFKTIDTSEKVNMTAAQWPNDTQLRNARVWFLVYGNAQSISTERARINILSEFEGATPIYQSDWSDFSDISPAPSTDYWHGWITFDFSDVHIDSDITYYLELEMGNYTRNGDTSYIAVKLETPYAVNDGATSVDNSLPVAVELYDFS